MSCESTNEDRRRRRCIPDRLLRLHRIHNVIGEKEKEKKACQPDRVGERPHVVCYRCASSASIEKTQTFLKKRWINQRVVVFFKGNSTGCVATGG